MKTINSFSYIDNVKTTNWKSAENIRFRINESEMNLYL